MSQSDRANAPKLRKLGWPIALGAILLAAASVHPLAKWSLAHEGHDDQEVGEFDLDAPRTISPQTAKHMGLKTAEIAVRPLEEVVEISGIVKPLPDRHRMIVSRVSGKVAAVFKRVGDPVKKNDLIARIDSPEFARNLYEARKLDVEYQKLLLEIDRSKANEDRLVVELEVAQARSDFAEAEFTRAQALLEEGVSKKELAQRKADASIARGSLKLRKIDLPLAHKETKRLEEQAKALRLSRDVLLVINNIDPHSDPASEVTGVLEIRATGKGVVVHRFVMPGQWVDQGAAIIEVVDYSVVQVEGEIPESLISRIRARKTKRVRIRTPSDPSYLGTGSIRYMAPQLDPIKRTAHLIVDVENPKGVLRGEMWVNLAVVLRETKSAFAVPRSAVVVHGPMHFVFRRDLNDEYTFQKQDITPGLRDDRYVEIKAGLGPGDVVVTQGAYSLTQIRPKRAAKKTAPPPAKAKTHAAGDE